MKNYLDNLLKIAFFNNTFPDNEVLIMHSTYMKHDPSQKLNCIFLYKYEKNHSPVLNTVQERQINECIVIIWRCKIICIWGDIENPKTNSLWKKRIVSASWWNIIHAILGMKCPFCTSINGAQTQFTPWWNKALLSESGVALILLSRSRSGLRIPWSLSLTPPLEPRPLRRIQLGLWTWILSVRKI